MSARQLIILAVAFVAAIGALFVIRGMNQPRPEPDAAEQVAINGQQVLVMTRNVPQGAALSSDDMAWRLFPQESVTDQFVRQTNTPEAQAEFAGGVTRRAFAAGEPVIAGSIVMPDGRGFLAAQLQPGYRAISIEIEPQSAAGGYIQPNDRVDVLVTTKTRVDSDGGGQEQVNTQIVLADVRVLALDDAVQTQESGDAPTRVQATVAVLELSQADSALVASARQQGELSLALRGVEAETANMRVPSAAPNGATQGGNAGGITLHTFGRTGGRS
jgi:pilus assembly protein CpaB